ncbi:Holliday junction DNA helicase RuvA [Candidatus Kaiserbacteria bacterium RIFCSPHIGHO2_01_FULL_56_24]|uniref:Holliday junction branch migration complex subunit RuvA n=1 Tax=Candidatus Kaiserbacteria bacterium RIFCSPHIGHO2_01_FULL_56_24 TaxID=1798487 RepID=A0A1F6DAX5_9BACT|nr:MAG: Holliday junction DNA helicase RuvA [Candidatus Kaiserbacteria bacterium RIFCSPHIGHO2_01_FULL_56_24]
MIGYLEGAVKAVVGGHLIVSVHGVGYKVAVTKHLLLKLSPGTPASLWTHLVVREDVLDLYGFESETDLRFFELLLTVSGVGPRSALAILDIASTETLRTAIARGNSEYLTKVSGIGRKTAEKIVIELRDKVGIGSEETSLALKGDEEALEAMQALGYTQAEARDALRKVSHTIVGGSARLREALKQLGI